MSKTKDQPALFDGVMMRVGGFIQETVPSSAPTAPLQARRSVPGLGEYVETGIFGKVVISEEFATEAEARRAGYCYDAAAYRVNAFGAREPVPYKVLGRWTDFTHKEFARVEDRNGKRSD